MFLRQNIEQMFWTQLGLHMKYGQKKYLQNIFVDFFCFTSKMCNHIRTF